MKAANHACSVFLRAIIVRMKQLGLNHTSLAARMHVSRPYVAKVLAGDVNISFGTALKFAKAPPDGLRPDARAAGISPARNRTCTLGCLGVQQC